MKKKSTLLKEQRAELHTWQARVRMDIASLKRTIARCKEEAAKLRKIQSEKP